MCKLKLSKLSCFGNGWLTAKIRPLVNTVACSQISDYITGKIQATVGRKAYWHRLWDLRIHAQCLWNSELVDLLFDVKQQKGNVLLLIHVSYVEMDDIHSMKYVHGHLGLRFACASVLHYLEQWFSSGPGGPATDHGLEIHLSFVPPLIK
jgi:hypothetical protein